MRCHACESAIEIAPGESLGFRSTCDACQADLHACLSCAHHDSAAYNECRESSAERVLDKDRANHCEYFRPGLAGGAGADAARNPALAELENLFKKK